MGGLGRLFITIAQTAFLSIPIGLSLWALLDCAKRPAWAWAMTERSQQVWMASILCGILLVPVGLVVSCWYLTKVRPEIAGVEEGRFPVSEDPPHANDRPDDDGPSRSKPDP